MYFFEKGIRSVQWGAPEVGAFSRIFVLKVALHSVVCKVTFNCKLQKKIGGAGCTSCSPNNFVGGARAYGHSHRLIHANFS